LRELKDQLISALLVILTVAAVISAGINFQQKRKFHSPEDGAIWVDRPTGVTALYVAPDSPAEKAGLKAGDRLISIAGAKIEHATDVPQILLRIGAWATAEYEFQRPGYDAAPAKVYLREGLPDSALFFQYAVGLVYLGIGLFVYFRRGSATGSLHFYVLCLMSFIAACFHYTGKLNNFDQLMWYGNVAANLLAPTIFLHFCLTFAETPRWYRRRPTVALLYVPALLIFATYVGLALGMIHVAASLVEVRWLLDRISMAYLSVAYLCGAWVLTFECRRSEDPITRRQLQWLRNGAVLGVLPFTLMYSIPYALGAIPTHAMNLSVISLMLIPLTWAYAILRYRLMDVDVIFQQGYAYTLATLAVIGTFYAVIFKIVGAANLSPTAMVLLLLMATFVFQPIRNWIQEVLGKHVFFKDQYDSRRTLIEFARELGAQTDLQELLESVADRLRRTLSIQHLAFFASDEHETGFHLQMTTARRKPAANGAPPDLSFLSLQPEKPYLFFERTRHTLDAVSNQWAPNVRRTISDLDLTYYVPCIVRGRTIAWLGASRTTKGDFLSSADIELLLTFAGYLGIAIENARLYHSLQRKVEENERLKEFSENIVESINVGILAADLEDRVESWNNQIERLTGISRDAALGRTLSELFPRDLYQRFDEVRGETGVHNIYKFALKPSLDGAADSKAARPGRETIVNLAIAPLISKDYRQIGRLIIFDDITDRAELESRLMQADKLSSIGLLAAGVAHEVNTPLAVISTYAQMLAKQVSEDDQKSKLLEKIAKQTFRASEIVNSLLNFSRTSSTEFVDVDVNRIIRETLNLVDHQLQKAAVKTEMALSEAVPAMKGSAGKLQQVFLNLFLNARDAMPSGGILAVRTWFAEETVHVEVADTGMGIAPEHLARIFDPFFTTKAPKKGTGLGLSVTYGIVREHGGTIEVQSQVGQGTRFTIELPLARKIEPAKVAGAGIRVAGTPVAVPASQ
jgi:two-component system, NtrC family, sensor kinase